MLPPFYCVGRLKVQNSGSLWYNQVDKTNPERYRNTMIRILFVCHGNICRSPMAEFIFKDMAQKAGVANEFYIASAATSGEEIWGGVGNPVYPPAKRELARHGISCGGKRAVRLKKDDYEKYDYIIGMDHENMQNMLRLFGGDKQAKLFKLMRFAGSGKDVSDPWYTGDFSAAYSDIETGCKALFARLENKLKEK